MNRNGDLLVSYSSSEDENDRTRIKKRKLPRLSPSLVVPTPVDNPALHQGRVRTTPHVEGQFAAYVYVSLKLERWSRMQAIVSDALSFAMATSPTIRPIVENVSDHDIDHKNTKEELHISLSRPTYLRAHQREDLKLAVKASSSKSRPFQVSFATFSELMNDERTRTFLTVEVGAGHHELKALADSLTPTLRAIRQQEFYVDPKFHASIGWALLDQPHSTEKTEVHLEIASQTQLPSTGALFLTIPHFPPDLISKLNQSYGARLTEAGHFEVTEICVKIGKEICKWPLVGT